MLKMFHVNYTGLCACVFCTYPFRKLEMILTPIGMTEGVCFEGICFAIREVELTALKMDFRLTSQGNR